MTRKTRPARALRRLGLTAALVVGFLTDIGPAASRITAESVHGAWRVQHFTSDQGGRRGCLLRANGTDGRRDFAIIMLDRPELFALVLTDRSWNLPQGLRSTLQIDIDTGYSRRLQVERDDATTVRMVFPTGTESSMLEFLKAFAAGSSMMVRLPDGQTLRASLDGSDVALRQWAQCLTRLEGGGGNPFGTPASGNPF